MIFGNVNKLLLRAIVLDLHYKLEYVLHLFKNAYESDKVESLTKNVKALLLIFIIFIRKFILRMTIQKCPIPTIVNNGTHQSEKN